MINGEMLKGLNSGTLKGNYKGNTVEIRILTTAGRGRGSGYCIVIRFYYKFPVMELYFKNVIGVFKGSQVRFKKEEMEKLGFADYRILCVKPDNIKKYLERPGVREAIIHLIGKGFYPKVTGSAILSFKESYLELACSSEGFVSMDEKINKFLSVASMKALFEDFINLKNVS